MTKFKVAFVNFYKEKRGRRVVEVKAVEGFSPDHHSDFDENQIYQVRCPHFPTEGSFSTEGLYDAKILCIGFSMEDLEHEAKINGLKIPKYTETEEMKGGKVSEKEVSAKKSLKGRSLKTSNQGNAQVKSEPDPRMKKKKKSTIEDKCREKRQFKVLDNYGDLVALPEVGSSKDDEVKKNSTKGESPSKSVFSCERKTESLLVSPGHSSPDSPLKFSVKDFQGKYESFLMTKAKSVVANQPQKSTFPVKPISPPGVCGLPLKMGKSPLRLGKSTSKFESSPSCESFHFSDLESPDKQKSDPLASDLESPDKQKSDPLAPKKSSSHLNFGSDSESAATEYVSSDEEMNLYRRKTITLENDFKRLKSENRVLNEKVASLSEKLDRYTNVNLKLQERLLAPSSLPKKDVDSELGPDQKFVSSNKAQKKLTFTDSSDSAPVLKSHNQDKQVNLELVKQEKGESLKRKLADPREESVTGNKDLAPMIVSALKSNSPLQSDGNGKVHLGNGVWVSEKLWKDKLRKSSCTPNIAIRDAMEKIYSREEMTQRSLEGGTPVRASSTGEKKIKMKMTPSKREAILGLYRAKTAVNTGSEDANFLDLAVAGKGKEKIRYKLKESARAYEKEKEENEKQEKAKKQKKTGKEIEEEHSDSD